MTLSLAHEPVHDGAPVLDYTGRIITRDDLARLPAPEPLIGDTLDRGTVAVLAGSWGSGKSFLALDWAACVATGRPWQGREIDRQRVLYVAAEGASGLHARLSAWETAWGTTVHPDYLNVLPLAPNLSRASERLALIDAVKLNGYGLVVIDTLAKCAVGMDENAAKDMGVLVDVLYRIQAATPHGAVLVLHHAGKSGTIRGSSALEAGVDTVYLVRKDGDEVTVPRAKAKDRAQEDEHHLVLRPIDSTESAILSVRDDVRTISRTEELMSVFMSAFSETGASKADLRAAADMAPASFSRALNNLVRDGSLVNTGTGRTPFYRSAA